MSQRKEFAILAMADSANMARLCQRCGISRKTGYKWLARYLLEDDPGLVDRGRRPRTNHGMTTRGRPGTAAPPNIIYGGAGLRARLP